MYPDFLGIGAQKAGTTWLGRNLQAHPEVWMPRVKEIHYFDEKIHESRNTTLRLVRRIFGAGGANRRWRRQVRRRARKHLRRFSRKEFSWDLNYYVGAPGDGWYASLFEPGRGRIIGEITPAYSTLAPDDVYRVHQLAPNARIVFMMRNPMERVWSQAVMSLDRSKGKAIDAVTEEEFLRIFNGEGSRRRTDYLLTLDTWSAYYPKDRIFVGFLEDVRFFPEELLRAVYEFLGVDPTFRPPRAGSKVHTRSTGSVPAAPLAHLARSYRDEISALCEHFGGYASFWRFCAERLAGPRPPRSTSKTLDVLVLGVDRLPSTAEGSSTRSDMIMLVRVTSSTGDVKLLSVPRDLYVEVEPGVEDRINTAYTYGGIKQARAVMEDLTSVQVDGYVIADFEGFEKVIAAIGGVEVDVGHGVFPEKWHMGEGVERLGGRKALFYARYRGTACGDLDRIDRQQRLLAALREQAIGWNTITRVPQIVKVTNENVGTDLGVHQAISLARALVLRGEVGEMSTAELEGHPTYLPDGEQVLMPETKANEAILQDFRDDAPKERHSGRAPRSGESYSEC